MDAIDLLEQRARQLEQHGKQKLPVAWTDNPTRDAVLEPIRPAEIGPSQSEVDRRAEAKAEAQRVARRAYQRDYYARRKDQHV